MTGCRKRLKSNVLPRFNLGLSSTSGSEINTTFYPPSSTQSFHEVTNLNHNLNRGI